MSKIYAKVAGLNECLEGLSPRIIIVFLVVLSTTFKLAYVMVFDGGLNTFPSEGSDATFYNHTAQILLQSGTYGEELDQPTTGMPPGEPAFLALLYAASGSSLAFAKLAHIALMTGVVVITYLTARRLVGALLAVWAGVLIAVDPAQSYLAATFLSEPLFIFLMVLGIYWLVRWGWHPHLLMLFGAGACFGLAGLTRNQGWLFPLALFAGAIVTRGWVLNRRAALIVLMATAVTIAPWTTRNFRLTGQFIPVSSEGGLTLWASNNPDFIFRPPMPMSLPIYDAPTGLSGSQTDIYYRQKAIEWISSHPSNFVVNGLRKIFVLYSFDPLSVRPEMAGVYRLAGIFPYGVLMPFIFLGLAINWREPRFAIILWYILFTTAMAFLFYGDSRIRATIQPYLYIFGVLGIEIVLKWLLPRSRIQKPQLEPKRSEG